MATGYTAEIEKGISFQEFVFKCARAMGVCITMRDDSLDTPIPETFEPDNYYLENLKKAKSELTKVEKWDEKVAQKHLESDYKTNQKYHSDAIKRKHELLLKYKTMLAKVKEWQPPSPEHNDFKQFMIDQIEDSIKWDCDIDYHQKQLNKPKQKAEKYKQFNIANLKKDIIMYEKRYKEELERTTNKNIWLKQLRDSLNTI